MGNPVRVLRSTLKNTRGYCNNTACFSLLRMFLGIASGFAWAGTTNPESYSDIYYNCLNWYDNWGALIMFIILSLVICAFVSKKTYFDKVLLHIRREKSILLLSMDSKNRGI